MPLTMTTNAPNFPFCVIAQGQAGLGASLPLDSAGVTVTADPDGVVAISLDPNPLRINSPLDPDRGTPSVASGVARVVGAAGTATVKASVLNPDGTTLAEATDTLTVVEPGPGIAQWAGELFGTATPVALSGAKGSHHSTHAAPHAAEAEKHKTHQK